MDRPEPEVNLLHPLATLAEWKEYSRMPVGMRDAQAVVLGDKVYIGGGDTPTGASSDLLIYDFKKDSWETVKTPTQLYSLAVYRSQLVLVGGVVCSHNTITNKIWVLGRKEKDEPEDCWDASLIPTMPTERFGTSAVGVGNHLIVAGGDKGGLNGRLNVVEVYDGHKWRTVQSLPRPCSRMKSAVHDGFWYLAGGVDQGKRVFYAYFEDLTAPDRAEQNGVWVALPDVPLERCTPVIFGMQLTAVGGLFRSAIHAYAHRTRSWVPVGKMPVAYGFSCSTVLPNGELLMVGGKTHHEISSHVFRTKLNATSFPDGKFTLNDLDRLEAASGISVYEQLAPEILPEMASTLQLDGPTPDNPKRLFEEWVLGKSALPPTWPTLVGVLLGVRHPLGSEIENFFNTQTPMTQAVSLLVEKKKKKESPSSEKKSEDNLGNVKVENQEIQTEVVETVEQSVQAEDTTQEQEEQVQVLEKELQECHDEREKDTRHIESLEAEIEELRRQVDHSQPSSMETTGSLRGVDVIAETSVLITNQAQTFNWAGYGLKLNVPKGALPAGLEECRLLMKVGLSGQFALPENTSLVTAVYWLDSEPRREFSKHLTLEIQHCVKPTHTSKLSFVQAKCSHMNFPYTFETVEGVFSTESAYGCVQLTHFSLLGVVYDHLSLLGLVLNMLLSGVQLYCARLYYLRKEVNQIDIHFVITKDMETHKTLARQEYTAMGAILVDEMRVDFESNSISLQEVNLEDGWRVYSVFHPVVNKVDVDIFKRGQRIPSCQLKAEWTKQSKPSRLIHKVTLEGAKPPSNYFKIDLDRDSIPLGGDKAPRSTVDQDLHSKYPAGLDSEPKVRHLVNEIAAKIPNKWKDVGLQLGLDHDVLEGIGPGDANHCYMKVFKQWKSQNSAEHPYLWSTIVRALQTQAVGEKRLAVEIENKLTGRSSQ